MHKVWAYALVISNREYILTVTVMTVDLHFVVTFHAQINCAQILC